MSPPAGNHFSLDGLAVLERVRQTRPDLPGPLLRLHIGLENPADLIADIEQALAVARG